MGHPSDGSGPIMVISLVGYYTERCSAILVMRRNCLAADMTELRGICWYDGAVFPEPETLGTGKRSCRRQWLKIRRSQRELELAACLWRLGGIASLSLAVRLRASFARASHFSDSKDRV